MREKQRRWTTTNTQTVDPRFFRALPGIFRSPTVTALASGRRAAALDEVCRASRLMDFAGTLTLRDVFEKLYAVMRKQYRCEYIFKNAVAAKVLLGRHSLRTASLLTELRVECRKADLVVLNGTSTVYEIKSELDNLDRLDEQIRAYRNVFDQIYVVTEEGSENRILNAVGSDIGVVILTRRYTLQVVHESTSHATSVSPASIFDTLRVAEYSRILREELGAVPDVPNGLRYRECKKMFSTLSPDLAHRAMVSALKRRASAYSADACYISSLPHSLKAAGLTTQLSASQRNHLVERLSAPYSPV